MTDQSRGVRHDHALRPQPAAMLEATCPCGRGEPYGDCCAPLHQGAAHAPTAERLMRSRYSAFVVGDAAYLLATWHVSTRPASLELDGGRRWLGLDVVDVERGGLLDATGVVEFVAHSVAVDGGGRGGRRETQSERSTFVREGGRWFYVDGVIA